MYQRFIACRSKSQIADHRCYTELIRTQHKGNDTDDKPLKGSKSIKQWPEFTKDVFNIIQQNYCAAWQLLMEFCCKAFQLFGKIFLFFQEAGYLPALLHYDGIFLSDNIERYRYISVIGSDIIAVFG